MLIKAVTIDNLLAPPITREKRIALRNLLDPLANNTFDPPGYGVYAALRIKYLPGLLFQINTSEKACQIAESKQVMEMLGMGLSGYRLFDKKRINCHTLTMIKYLLLLQKALKGFTTNAVVSQTGNSLKCNTEKNPRVTTHKTPAENLFLLLPLEILVILFQEMPVSTLLALRATDNGLRQVVKNVNPPKISNAHSLHTLNWLLKELDIPQQIFFANHRLIDAYRAIAMKLTDDKDKLIELVENLEPMSLALLARNFHSIADLIFTSPLKDKFLLKGKTIKTSFLLDLCKASPHRKKMINLLFSYIEDEEILFTLFRNMEQLTADEIKMFIETRSVLFLIKMGQWKYDVEIMQQIFAKLDAPENKSYVIRLTSFHGALEAIFKQFLINLVSCDPGKILTIHENTNHCYLFYANSHEWAHALLRPITKEVVEELVHQVANTAEAPKGKKSFWQVLQEKQSELEPDYSTLDAELGPTIGIQFK